MLPLPSNSSGLSLERHESLSRTPHTVMPMQRGTFMQAWVRPAYWVVDALVTSTSVSATSTPRAAKLDSVVWKLPGSELPPVKWVCRPDAVDRHAAGLEVLDHVVDALRLGVGPVLDVVVVVAELDRRVGGAGGAERHLDPVVAGALQVGLPAAAVLVERLVHHVPGGQLALVVGHHPVDVVDHRLAQGAAAQALHPARLLRVPGQGVAADLHAALGRPVVDLVAGGEVELARAGARSRRASSRSRP